MRLRLILSFVLIVLVTIASVLVIARQGAVSEVRMFMRGSMMGLDDLALQLEYYYQETGSWQGADMLLTASRGGHGMGQGMMAGGPRLRLADASGQIVADTRGDAEGGFSRSERQAATVLRDAQGETIGYLLAEGGSAGSPYAEQQLLQRLLRAGLVAGAVSGAVAILIGLLLSYRLLKPVEDLTQAAANMAGGDLSQRVQASGKDELGTLGRAFNHMAASLQRGEQNRRAMTADIAHELRTPIAIQRAHLEAIEDGVYPLTLENLQPVLEQTELLTRLVEDLRTLALADAGELHMELAPTDLAALVQRVTERFRPEAETRQVRLTLVENTRDGLDHIPLDAGRTEQILNNLLSNALRYTSEGGSVQVALNRHDGWVEVSVTDDGPGIPPEALPHLFERFYRADRSRSRSGGGTGLGLAIARQLALAHGGDLSASNRPEGGAAFLLRLPVA